LLIKYINLIFFRMNYTTFIVKIISKPEQSFFNNDITVTEFLGKFYQFRDNTNTVCKLSVWGNFAYEVIKYYNINDYLLVEGYLSFRKSTFEDSDITTEIEISAFKIYPFALQTSITRK